MKPRMTKYSMGIGDRFSLEGPAQLRALQMAKARGVSVAPVWNKSNREHSIIGTDPMDVRREADAAIATCAWSDPYFVDADHIGLGNVDKFMEASDFFTIDIADFIGEEAADRSIVSYVDAMQKYVGALKIPGIDESVEVSRESLKAIASRYLFAIEEAGRVYRHIAEKKGAGQFVTEVSLDEASAPQTPAELFFILAGLAREGVPADTVAPKFTGEFLKGIDYVGDITKFTQEFGDDLAVVKFATSEFKLPASLKLSIHSGSDKFSLYPIIHKALKNADAGVHLKTAGTTWLEEVIGLAAAGDDGLEFAKSLYRKAFERYDEMAAPYLPVIQIDRPALPSPAIVAAWSADQFVKTLEHDQSRSEFSVHFRQLVHISFKIAAENRELFDGLLQKYRRPIEAHVTKNIFNRHALPLLVGASE